MWRCRPPLTPRRDGCVVGPGFGDLLWRDVCVSLAKQGLELGDAAGKGRNDAFVAHPVVAILEFFEERAGVL